VKKPGRGRPPIAADDRRDSVVPVRFTTAEHTLVQRAAEADGMSLSLWISTKAVAAAQDQERT